MKELILIASMFLFGGCTEVVQLVTGPSNDSSGLVQNVDQALVRECRLAPSFVKMTNGDEVRVEVRTFAGGSVEVIVWPVSASIEGEQLVQILPSTPSSTANRELILKARGVGDTALVVRVGSASCTAPITVTAASP
jgi:hypothetical protein